MPTRPENSHVVKRKATGPANERLRLIARMLPVLPLVVWVVTIWVPVLDSSRPGLHTSEYNRIVVTSLGSIPVEMGELELEFVTIWACLLTCAISAWLLSGLKLWSWATAIFGASVMVFLSDMIAEPPIILWDGQDSSGRPIGGMEVAAVDVGAGLWLAGGVALIAAGVCGLVGERRRTSAWSVSGEGLRIARWFSTEPSRDGRIHVRRYRSVAEQVARLLPLVSVAAWMVMIWVPIFANHASDDKRVTLTSLGTPPINMVDPGLDVILPWVLVLFCAAVSRLMEPPLWWSVVVILFGIALLIMSEVSMFDPPTVRSVVNYSSGESSEVTISGYPDAGVGYWILGSGALVCAGTAGIAGHLGDRRRRSFR